MVQLRTPFPEIDFPMRYAIPRDTIGLLGNTRIENASLLFEKFLLPLDYAARPEQKDDALKRLLESPATPDAQRKAKSLGEQIHRTYRRRARTLFASLQSRLAINLADGLLENAGICLDRNTGAPYIPASAVKGCCHHAAFWMEKDGDLESGTTDRLFGTTQAKGLVTFLPAFPEGPFSFDLDILTPHPRKNGKEENPVPNKYPVVKEGARFAFSYFLIHRKTSEEGAPQINSQHELLEKILEAAFTAGMGAKTAAGLGWFQRDRDYEREIRERREKEAEEIAEREKTAQLEAARRKEAEQRKADEIAKQREAEQRKADEEKAAQEAYQKASPEERLRMDWSQLSKGDFGKELAGILDKPESEQRILLEVFLAKNQKNRKKFLKEKKIGPRIKQAAQTLKIELS